MVAHSMGARAVAGSSERLAQFFPALPADSPGFPQTLPPKTTLPVATSQGSALLLHLTIHYCSKTIGIDSSCKLVFRCIVF